jgi:hypothetical protein
MKHFSRKKSDNLPPTSFKNINWLQSSFADGMEHARKTFWGSLWADVEDRERMEMKILFKFIFVCIEDGNERRKKLFG